MTHAEQTSLNKYMKILIVLLIVVSTPITIQADLKSLYIGHWSSEGGEGGILKYINLESGEVIYNYTGLPIIRNIHFNNEKLYVGGNGGYVRIFDKQLNFTGSFFHGGTILSIYLYDDEIYIGSNQLTIGANIFVMRVYNANTLSYTGKQIGGIGQVNDIKVTEDYVYLGTTSNRIYKLYRDNLSIKYQSDDMGGNIVSMTIFGDYIYGSIASVNQIRKFYLENVSYTGISGDLSGPPMEIFLYDQTIYTTISSNPTLFTHEIDSLNNTGNIGLIGNGGSITADENFLFVFKSSRIYKIYRENHTIHDEVNISNVGTGFTLMTYNEEDFITEFEGETSINLETPINKDFVYVNASFLYNFANGEDINYLIYSNGDVLFNQTYNDNTRNDDIIIYPNLSVGNYTIQSFLINEEENYTTQSTQAFMQVTSLPSITKPSEANRTAMTTTITSEIETTGNLPITNKGFRYRYDFQSTYTQINNTTSETLIFQEPFILVKSFIENADGETTSEEVILEKEIITEGLTFENTILDIKISVMFILLLLTLTTIIIPKWSLLLGSGLAMITLVYTTILYTTDSVSGLVSFVVIGGLIITTLVLTIRSISE